MAKKATNKKTQARKQRKARARRPAITQQYAARIGSHVRMVMDPCNAPLGPTAYRGADGFVSRTKRIDSIALNNTSPYGVYVYYPAYNGIWSGTVASNTASLTPSFVTPGPGQAFYLSTADSMRPVGACVQVAYQGTELGRNGMIYRAVLPVSALSSGTFNDLKALCQRYHRIPDAVTETKWTPSPVDEEYWQVGATTPISTGDQNAIVVLVELGDTTTSITLNATTTLIAEWRPRYGTGLQTPNPNTPDPPAGLERVRNHLANFGNWYLEATATVGRALMTMSTVAGATRALQHTMDRVGLLTL